MLQWHRSRQSNEMTSLLILLPAVLLGTGRFSFSKSITGASSSTSYSCLDVFDVWAESGALLRYFRMKFLWLACVAGASDAGYFMVRNSAKKLDNLDVRLAWNSSDCFESFSPLRLDVRFVCSFISKKFHSLEKRVWKDDGNIPKPVWNVVLLPC